MYWSNLVNLQPGQANQFVEIVDRATYGRVVVDTADGMVKVNRYQTTDKIGKIQINL